jgi:predicted small metal-binding protein
MAKIVRGRDIGFDCEGIIRAESEEEALAQAAEHAQTVHGLTEITDDLVEAVRTAMGDE